MSFTDRGEEATPGQPRHNIILPQRVTPADTHCRHYNTPVFTGYAATPRADDTATAAEINTNRMVNGRRYCSHDATEYVTFR